MPLLGGNSLEFLSKVKVKSKKLKEKEFLEIKVFHLFFMNKILESMNIISKCENEGD